MISRRTLRGRLSRVRRFLPQGERGKFAVIDPILSQTQLNWAHVCPVGDEVGALVEAGYVKRELMTDAALSVRRSNYF